MARIKMNKTQQTQGLRREELKRSSNFGRKYFLTIAVLFHIIYAMSIFDIYFVSPIVHGMTAFETVEKGMEAPSKRLVLYVGDGLRADKAFQAHPDPSPPEGTRPEDAAKPRHLMPYLRSKILIEATFGVSHTRVPTESRPGHVALIAGLYEDVSAVTTGWQHNPVNFDSVFNRSSHTWSWGSPDILPMFQDGAVPGRVDAFSYGAEAEDFTSDAVKLDIWVFDRVKALFAQAKTNSTLDRELRQEKVVFFLHLLGLDTTGHAYRPYSKEYLHNIKIVDQGVKEITELIDDFYQDGKTSYVFTADHGMSDWGSHGDGHPDNTRTPLIAWGSGVAKPVPSKKRKGAPGHEDGFSADWNLSQIPRHDVAQADVAALMAYLAGLEMPVNSVGELPLAYLDATPKRKAQALLVNARTILEMYRVKEEQKKATRLRYAPYPGFAYDHKSPARRIEAIHDLIAKDRNDEAIKRGQELIQDALQGLRYLQTYDWLFLRALVTLGYIGWIAFAITTIIDAHVLGGTTLPQRSLASHVAVSGVAVALAGVLIIQKAPWSYYAYAIFPLYFWEQVNARRAALSRGKDALFGKGKTSIIKLGGTVFSFVAILELLVQSYFHRTVYSICYIIGIGWPWLHGQDFVKKNQSLVASWVAASIVLSGFTFLPANKVENLQLILSGGILMFAVGGVAMFLGEKTSVQSKALASDRGFPIRRTVIGAQVGLVVLAMLTTYSSVLSIQSRQGLPLGTQIVGWLVMLTSLILPFLHALEPSNDYSHRLLIVFLTFSPSFIILTISYEGLFYLAFCVLLLTWIRLEHSIFKYVTGHNAITTANGTPSPTANGKIHSKPGKPSSPADSATSELLNPIAPIIASTSLPKPIYRALTAPDLRISLFTLYFLQSAFFSTGNIASVASFSLDAVYRLIPVFDPFSQGALLVLKILIPFAILSAHLGILNRLLGLERGALMMVVVGAADWLTLRFFWMVRDEGSWLEIGSSISMFCIASALCGFVAALEGVGELMIRGVEVDDPDDTDRDKFE